MDSRFILYMMDWPRLSYVLIGKIMGILSFSFFIWLARSDFPIWEATAIVAVWSVVTSPIGYFATYYLGSKKE